jgi:hypothetical protein
MRGDREEIATRRKNEVTAATPGSELDKWFDTSTCGLTRSLLDAGQNERRSEAGLASKQDIERRSLLRTMARFNVPSPCSDTVSRLLCANTGHSPRTCRTGQIDPQETFGVEAINGRNGPGSNRSGTSVSREIQALVSVSRFCPSPRSRPPYDVHKRLRGSASISFGVAQRVVTTLRKREVGLAKQPRFDARRSD